MAKARAIIKRRKSVQNIRKITRTMELIATARFKKAFDRATEAEAYTRKIAEIVADLTVLDILRHHLRQQPLPVEQLYVQRFRMLKDLLPLCHASQVVEDELPVTRPARRRESSKPGSERKSK